MNDQITTVSGEKLARAMVDLDAELALLTAERKAIVAELMVRYAVAIDMAFDANKKTHGKVKVLEGSLELEAEVRQTVEWDQAKLTAAGESMAPDEARHLLKVELSVPEKVYNALPPGDVKDALTTARTTKLSAPSIKVRFPKVN